MTMVNLIIPRLLGYLIINFAMCSHAFNIQCVIRIVTDIMKLVTNSIMSQNSIKIF